jgi:hypothetical protein
MRIEAVGPRNSIDVCLWKNDPLLCQMLTTNNTISLWAHKNWLGRSYNNLLRISSIGILEHRGFYHLTDAD